MAARQAPVKTYGRAKRVDDGVLDVFRVTSEKAPDIGDTRTQLVNVDFDEIWTVAERFVPIAQVLSREIRIIGRLAALVLSRYRDKFVQRVENFFFCCHATPLDRIAG